MKSGRSFLYAGLLAGITAILVTSIYNFQPDSQIEIPDELSGVVRSYQPELKPFHLTSHLNQPYTLDQLKNKQSLIFFGYTSCPDICPTTLTSLNNMLKILATNNLIQDLQVIFISVDPQRDSIDKLADYMNYFNPEFIALTGSKNEIDNIAKQFSAAYFIEKGNTEENYLISHASSIFLVDSNTRLIAAFSPPHYPDILAQQYQQIHSLMINQ